MHLSTLNGLLSIGSVFFVDSIKMLIRNVFYMPEDNRLEYLDYHHDGFISLFASQAAHRKALRLPVVS